MNLQMPLIFLICAMLGTLVLEKGNLRLRPVSKGDGPSFFVLRSNPVVNRYIKRQPPADLKETEVWLERILNNMQAGASYNWCLVDSSGQVIGSVCLWNISPDRKCAELGYDLLPQHHGKGLMRAAVAEVLKFGFNDLDLDRVTAYTHRENRASIKMLEWFTFRLTDQMDADNENNLVFELHR